MKWNLAEATEVGKVGQMTTLGSDLSVASATSHVGFNIGRINGRLLDLELSALEQKQQVDIIASPRLLASHMQPASIKQGSEIPYRSPAGEWGHLCGVQRGGIRHGGHPSGTAGWARASEITYQ